MADKITRLQKSFKAQKARADKLAAALKPFTELHKDIADRTREMRRHVENAKKVYQECGE